MARAGVFSCLPVWLLLHAAGVSAHEARPAYLELQERSPGVFDVLWRRPARGDRVLSLSPMVPAHCERIGARIPHPEPGAIVERWSIDCGAAGLAGHVISIDGLQATLTDVLVRVAFAGGVTHAQVLRPASRSFTVAGRPSRLEISGDYLRLGVEHILGGFDHLLFVLGLVLLVTGGRRLVATITAFTLAHSVTLAASTVGLLHVPQPPVEAAIALSIVLVAGEILRVHRGQGGVAPAAVWQIAFGFGLLHGLGFAGALAEVGLPRQEVPLALLFFNVGVELGQLAFVAAVLGAWHALRRLRFPIPRAAALAAPYAMGGMATAWVMQRVAAF